MWVLLGLPETEVKYCKYKSKQYVVKHNSIHDFIKVYFYVVSFNYMFRALVMSHLQVDYFFIKVKYAFSNAIVIVTYEISYNIQNANIYSTV